MRHCLLLLITISLLFSQEESSADTTVSVSADTGNIQQIEPEIYGLDYGYKGYKWGTGFRNIPQMENMTISKIDSIRKTVTMEGNLGLDSVQVIYVYSDSGFWKVEIDFQINQDNTDEQIKQFLGIEINISEVYGNPFSTEQTVHGPSSSYNNFLHVKYTRSFYRSSWNVSPARIMLVLNSVVQQPKTVNNILEGKLSFLKLAYYNPDYMKSPGEQANVENLPSIFDIY